MAEKDEKFFYIQTTRVIQKVGAIWAPTSSFAYITRPHSFNTKVIESLRLLHDSYRSPTRRSSQLLHDPYPNIFFSNERSFISLVGGSESNLA